MNRVNQFSNFWKQMILANTVLEDPLQFLIQIHIRRVCRISRNIVFESTTRRQRRGFMKVALGRSRRLEDKHVSNVEIFASPCGKCAGKHFRGIFFFFATSLTESRLGPVTYCKSERRVNTLHVPPPSAWERSLTSMPRVERRETRVAQW